MMTRLLFALMLAAPLAVGAQDWEYQSDFPVNAERQFSSTHGLAVDGAGRIWVQPYGIVDSVMVDGTYMASGTVTVFDPDGTEAACSPIRYLTDASGTVVQYLGRTDGTETQTGRGLRADKDGNVLVTQGSILLKVDHTSCNPGGTPNTARLLAQAKPFTGSMVAAGTDPEGNFYITQVVGGGDNDKIKMLDPDLNEIGEFGSNRTFNRTLLAAGDGGDDGGVAVWDFSYTTGLPVVHYRPDDFSDFDSLGVTPLGMAVESATIQPETGWIWFSAGSPNDVPLAPWLPNTWYGFALEDLFTFNAEGDITGTIEVPTPRDSFTWNDAATDGRPRGIAFSADGMTAYVGQFNEPVPATQKFIKMDTAEEGGPSWAAVVELHPNTPNPVTARTTFSFTTREAGDVRIRIFDTAGRQVATAADRPFGAGTHSVEFDASTLSAGVYLYAVDVNGFGTTGRMTVVR